MANLIKLHILSPLKVVITKNPPKNYKMNFIGLEKGY